MDKDLLQEIKMSRCGDDGYQCKQFTCWRCNDEEFINFTPHPVDLLDDSGKIIKTYQSQGAVRLSSCTERISGTYLSKTVFGHVEGLPEPIEGKYYIVSQMIKSALPDRLDLVIPTEVLRDKKGAITGCRSFGL